MPKMKVKFLVDKEQKRVIFAEAGSDFVDVLFSFLTLPLGRIVQLLKKQSAVGSVDSLYECVEQLDAMYFQTEACKEILLDPRSAAAEQCENLKIKSIHDPRPRGFYVCKENDCLVKSTIYYSYTAKCRCSRCGKLMDRFLYCPKEASKEGGVFVNGINQFIITDDLRVIPVSLKEGVSILKELKIEDASILDEMMIDFGKEEALTLLEKSLVSKYALTGVCWPESCIRASADCSLLTKKEKVVDGAENEIILNLVLDKKTNSVLYAEVGEDFINQLLSFLTFPLGSVFKFLSDNIFLGGCINNLYSSVRSMSLDFFKSEICRNMLLAPKISTFYGIKNQMLDLEEVKLEKSSVSGRYYWNNGSKLCAPAPCLHGIRITELVEQNPRSVKGVADSERTFVVGSRRFMVADNLHISPLLAISAIGNKMKSPTSNLIIEEVSFGKGKVCSLLGTMLVSKAVLTDVLSPKPKRLKRSDE